MTETQDRIAQLEQQLAEFATWKEAFNDRANDMAAEAGMCRTFERGMRELGLRGRPQNYSIIVVRGIERYQPPIMGQYLAVNVQSYDEDDARRIVRERIETDNLEEEDNNWRTLESYQLANYLPEAAQRNLLLETAVRADTVVIAPRVHGDPELDEPDDDEDNDYFDE